ncbi:MAG TPA: 3'-5' exonuclease, partial [Xanthobacteraceae bacterium]|nr:3'-5' exonuclease [Xanthobacteraceae bacterium]
STLRAALNAKAADLEFIEAQARLTRYAAWAAESPFAFYSRILGTDKGRARFYARLGPEAADALDEFLEHALMYERDEAPTLQGFVAWLRGGIAQVKRDMDIARDEVRVMTVHGAKGLEAPIVILADTTTVPKGPREPRMVPLPVAKSAPGTPDRLVWAGRKADDPEPVAAARAVAVREAEDEHRRLLYVGMTRAADRLVIAGSRGVNRIPPGCWYELVSDALKPEAVEEATAEGAVWRWRQRGPEAAAGVSAAITAARHDVPEWLHQPVPPEPRSTRAIAPSLALGSAKADAQALARGRIVHRLLQALPALPSERRRDAARQTLARAKVADAEQVLDEVLTLIDDPRCAALFAPGSRAEVPIVGILPDGRQVSGQADRLAITSKDVLIADYKSDRIVPGGIERIAPHYITQLALYRAVLGTLYPNHTVRAALVWTAGPALTELPPAALDAAMSRLPAAQDTVA